MPTEFPLLALEETAGLFLGTAICTRQEAERCFTCTFLYICWYINGILLHTLWCVFPCPAQQFIWASPPCRSVSASSLSTVSIGVCCTGSSLPRAGFLWLRRAGTPLEGQCAGVSLWSSLLCRAQALRLAGFSRVAHGRSSCGRGV